VRAIVLSVILPKRIELPRREVIHSLLVSVHAPESETLCRCLKSLQQGKRRWPKAPKAVGARMIWFYFLLAG
jgi:hypothetical protein